MMSYRREREIVAYELYEKNGWVDGNDLDHWLEAERIVSARQAEKTAVSGQARRRAPTSKKSVPARVGKATQKMPEAGLS